MEKPCLQRDVACRETLLAERRCTAMLCNAMKRCNETVAVAKSITLQRKQTQKPVF
jgi:hypothetical protein